MAVNAPLFGTIQKDLTHFGGAVASKEPPNREAEYPASTAKSAQSQLVTRYSERFVNPDAVESYQQNEYAPDSYASFIWELQKPFLKKTIQSRFSDRPLRLLDFACGTGRIISFLEDFAHSSEGVDISPAMLARAAGVCRKSKLEAGDICTNVNLAKGPFDVISAFRFLLNADADVRRKVLASLRQRIAEDGLLIINLHGNSRSLRHFAVMRRRKLIECGKSPSSIMVAEESLEDMRALLRESGFEIVEEAGFGIMPPALDRTFLRPLSRGIDRLLSEKKPGRRFCIDVIFVCRPLARNAI